LSTF